MAVRYPEVPQVVDPAETHINHFCDRLINRINERRVELLTTVRDTRREKDSRPAARARMEEELIALKSETLLKLQMNVLRDTQQQILEQLEAKLVEARTPIPETRIVFRGEAQHLEQLIRGVGEILEEEPKFNSEDNKCPFCFIQKPAGELLEHKRTCTMNPNTEPISTHPLVALKGHQERCLFRGEDFYQIALEPELTPEDSSSLIPCEFCNQPFEMDEISTHQLSCQLITNLPVRTVHDRTTRCEFCGVFFTITEIGPHRIKCTFRRPALASKYRTSRRETKCKYCFEVFELEEVENHQNICPKRQIVGGNKIYQHCYKMFAFTQKTVPPKKDFHMELKIGGASNTSNARGTFNKPPIASSYSPSASTSTSRQKTHFQMNQELTSPSSRIPPTYPEHSRGIDSLSSRRGSDTKHPRTEIGYQKFPASDRVVYRPPSDTDDYLHTVSNGTETIIGMHSTPPKKSPGTSTDKYLATKRYRGSQTHY